MSTHKERWANYVCGNCGDAVQVKEEQITKADYHTINEHWVPTNSRSGMVFCPNCGECLNPSY